MKNIATINRSGLNNLNLGRLNKLLNKRYNFSEGIFTLEEYILKFGVGKKLCTVGLRNGNVKENVPSLILDKTGHSIDIPKMVYDNLFFTEV